MARFTEANRFQSPYDNPDTLGRVVANDPYMRIVLWAIMICVPLFSGTTLALSAENEIVVGVSTGYPPYYYVRNGELVGVCIDLANRVAESIELKISYRQYPWKRLLLNARMGHVDAIMPLFKTKEREAYLYFDNLDLVDEENRFFTWKDAKFDFNGSIQNLQPFEIGVVAGYSYGNEFDAFPNLKKVPTKNDHHLVKMFKHKRFDVGIGSIDVVIFNARQEDIADRIQFLKPAITKSPLYIGFSKAKAVEELAKRFSAALEHLKSTPEYRVILEKNGLVFD